jgi:two-component system response regulator YesN
MGNHPDHPGKAAGREEVPEGPLAAPIKEQIQKAKDFIAEQYKEEGLDREAVAQNVCLNADYFGVLFKKETGTNFGDYLTEYRLQQAEGLLKNTKMDISQIAYQVGFGSLATFSRAFKKRYAVAPKGYRKHLTGG